MNDLFFWTIKRNCQFIPIHNLMDKHIIMQHVVFLLCPCSTIQIFFLLYIFDVLLLILNFLRRLFGLHCFNVIAIIIFIIIAQIASFF